MEEGLGFLGTITLTPPPVLGVLTPTNGHIVGLESPPLLAKEWTHVAIKYLIEFMKERIESYGTNVFKQQHWERIIEQAMRDYHAEARRIWTKVRTSSTSSSDIITRNRKCTMPHVIMHDHNEFDSQ